ncbi:GATA-type sexual development transcription factor NsdD [Aspergillus neoniger CBS 115656]|uniref:GATA-type domain-containing protein n=1 Tax=Aspergillus neoniger (strain CBS 115656) TaxID=1448310 RepID=A0A318YES5_ASPNB|nr:hypothetical protein BO87DRAFT_311672 [Aspergillus neoniger CBS 115656]PYH32856.1 hypothetical protein BO87DRAFT_311672 [Aspergillus neoniger CBS 115656]
MGPLEAEHRHREHLPALGYLGKDGPSYAPKHPGIATAHTSSPTPLLSPTTMYTGQPLPVSYTSSTGPGHLQAGYISPPDSRRALEEEKDKQQQQPQRQSLPSIHEALGNDNHLPYPAPTPAPPQQAHHAPPHSLPSNIVGRPATEGPPGPPNPFSSGAATGPFMREPAFQHQLQAEASRSSLTSINTQDSRNASLQSLNSGKSPTQSAKTGITSISGSQVGSGYEYSAPPSAGSVASPNGYGAFSQSFSFQPQPPSNAATYASTSYDARSYAGTSWKPGVPETARVDDVKPSLATRPAIAGQPQSDSVKRHLDIYDVETSLNEIAEMSTRTLDFSRHYAARAHHTQRSGPVLGSLPSIHEVEEMLNIQRHNQDALIRIRTAILNQEHALAEQMAQRKAFKAGGVHDDVHHMAMYQEEYKGSGGFAGPDSKKRRGKAAPPGRCHSCNRAETPEWRRGPDGARTLCNACGLHYAKLTRKMGANKASSLGSNLKPKTALDSASPSSH